MSEELYAVLVPMPNGDSLILPKSVVEEVVFAEGLVAREGPPWLAGTLPYEGREIPVVRWEVLNGGSAGGTGRRTRLAVLNGISGRVAGGQFGLITEGHPHLVTLSRPSLVSVPLAENDLESLVLSRVRIANTTAAVPDLEALEGAVADLDPGTAD